MVLEHAEMCVEIEQDVKKATDQRASTDEWRYDRMVEKEQLLVSGAAPEVHATSTLHWPRGADHKTSCPISA